MPTSTPPIGIRSINITNFRRIDKLRLEFAGSDGGPSDIAVLAGPNGCGKTAVLEACLVALNCDPDKILGKVGPDAVRSGQRDYRIEVDLSTRKGGYTGALSSDGRADWRNVSRGQESAPPAVPCLYFSSWRAPKLVGALAITAGRPGRRPKDSEPNRVRLIKQRLINARAHYTMSPVRPSLFPPSAAESPAPHEADLRRLNEVWEVFYPGSEERFDVGPVSDDPDAGFDVFLQRPDGGRVSVDALSSGQLELFALFGALILERFRDGVVVIDEPELHLDPQWHAPMLRAIRRFLPTAQLIVATHSPRVYDSVLSFQRHLLVPDDDPRARPWVSAG